MSIGGMKARTFSGSKNPERERVILNAFANLFDRFRCRHQKNPHLGIWDSKGYFGTRISRRLHFMLNP